MMTRPGLSGVRGFLVVVALAWAGCTEGGVRPCSVGADCASGVCLVDGSCAPMTADATPDGVDGAGGADANGDVAAGDGAVADTTAEPAPDGATADAAPDGSDGVGPLVCSPDHDGVVTRAEVPMAAGLRATYAIATDVDFDTTAGTGPGGEARWDMAAALPGEQRALVETLDPADWWFGAVFPTATYATRLGATNELLGVFRVSDDGLDLLGVVSPTDGLLRTELRYDPPARLLAFPLEVGAAWTTTSAVTGVTSGVPTVASERYESTVDAAGVVATPFAALPALRVVVSLDRLVGAVLYYEMQHIFVAECFGTVATIRSQPYVSTTEFTSAAELRRLAP